MMKKSIVSMVLAVGCATIISPVYAAHQPVAINPSPDKYTYYVKDYIGMRLSEAGYVSLGGDLRDQYGTESVLLTLINDDGKYIDLEDEESLKDYVVVGQNEKPNTEIKFMYGLDENGDEDDTFPILSCEEIVLKVQPNDGLEINEDTSLTEINTSPDRYTFYIKDYTGRNLASCGYKTLGGDLRDAYGEGSVKIVPRLEDGTTISVEDEEALKGYKVVSQNIEPNSEFKMEYSVDENGIEENYVEHQGYEELSVTVQKIDNQNTTEEPPVSEETTSTTDADGIRPEVKEAIDSYETFMNDYCDFMKKYAESDDQASLLTDYMDYLNKFSDFSDKVDAINDDLTDEENAYYLEVINRVNLKLIESAN